MGGSLVLGPGPHRGVVVGGVHDARLRCQRRRCKRSPRGWHTARRQVRGASAMTKKIKPPKSKEEAVDKEQAAADAEVAAQAKAEEEAAAAAAAAQDEFQARGFELVEWVQENRGIVMGVIGVVIVAGLGYGISTVVKRGADTEASAAWAKAQDIWQAPVGEDPNPDDNIPAYDTAKAKAEAAKNAFTGVIKAHEGTGAGALAQLSLGHANLQLGDYAGATAAYQAFLNETDSDDPLRFAGYSGLAAAKEGAGDAKGAIEALEALVALSDKVDEDAALFGLGRLYAKEGDSEKARKRLETLVADSPDSKLRARADELLATLGPKAGGDTKAAGTP